MIVDRVVKGKKRQKPMQDPVSLIQLHFNLCKEARRHRRRLPTKSASLEFSWTPSRHTSKLGKHSDVIVRHHFDY